MAIGPGSRIGPYEVTALLGEGGMGKVWRAHHGGLKRDDALKVLPDAFASDPERLARFQREAQVLASLNHPNIAQVHGLEQADGVRALVMELVEGPTLADRIAQGPIPVDEALPLAKQVAEALEAAHERGIIHRDLKPANIKLRPDGTVKVLDFGLAKALEPVAAGSVDATASPTITSPAMMTGVGMLLGTAAYMSPEQARGKAVDKRSDIWAFGCVLYEMLTGRRAFAAEDVADTLAFALTREPDWGALPNAIPVAVRTLLRRCLTKDRRRRLDSAAAAQLDIDDALTRPVPDAPVDAAAPASHVWRHAMPGAAMVIVGLVAGYAAWALKPTPPPEITRFAIALAEGETLPASPVAVSPDGTRLVYTANNRLYLRRLDQLNATPIAGVPAPALASARGPTFSPDGQWIAFWELGELKKVSVSGGAPVTVCTFSSPPPSAVTWAADNTIWVSRGTTGIWRVSGEGGTLEQIIKVDAGQSAHGPQLLPDGRTVLFTVARNNNWDEAQIVVQSLDDGTRTTLITGGTDGRYLSTGHLVYALRDSMLAVPFDPTSLRISGGPVPVVEGVGRLAGSLSASAQFAVSSTGTLAYSPPVDVPAARGTLAWVDRQGREEPIPVQPGSYAHPRLAPDGTRLALDIQDENQNEDIWVWEFQRRTLTRVTSDPGTDRSMQAVWTPDGQRIIFGSLRTGRRHLFWQAANGTGNAERIVEGTGQVIVPYTLSPDGGDLVFRGVTQSNSDLMIVAIGTGRRAQTPSAAVAEQRPLVQTSFEEYNAEISPDGRWLAYQSNSSGVFEIYVRPFPDVASGQWLVSTGGGTEPLWGRDSRELFYRDPDGAVMRVAVTPAATWAASTPTQLFEGTSYALGANSGRGASVSRTYDVSPDGRRFLMIKNSDAPAQASTAPRIVVVRNWTEELKRLVPVD